VSFSSTSSNGIGLLDGRNRQLPDRLCAPVALVGYSPVALIGYFLHPVNQPSDDSFAIPLT
jgi:hypothetical protein